MRAVVYDRYGPPNVLRLEEVERPVPKEDEVLVKIHATTVNRTDCGLRSAKPFITRFFTGFRRPKQKTLGMELAGEVEAVGAAATEFEVGDPVFGVKGFGAHVEFVCMRENAALAEKPDFDTVGKHSFRRCRYSLKSGGTFIDRCYSLEDVIEATRYVETQQKTGNVVLTVNGVRAR
jgi:NADPH:quinone reductase-like Zn-dependent oxidoreductase